MGTAASFNWVRVGLSMFVVAFGANLFAPLLPAYRAVDSLSQSQVTFLLAIYVAGLIPALLIGGPASDIVGRRALVRPALLVSAVGSVILMASARWGFPTLIVGRLIIGISVGMVMAAGASWLKEISTGPTAVSARRATIALSAGFSLGPLASGLVAQFAPHPDVFPYVVHLLLLAIIIPLAWSAPGGAPTSQSNRATTTVLRSPRFLIAVAAWAPWVFGVATTSFAVLPTLARTQFPIAWVGLVAFITMGTGVLVQPFATRITKVPSAAVGLLLTALGLAVAAAVSATGFAGLVLLGALLLGSAYGVMMVSGLREVQVIAPPQELGTATAVFYSLTYVGFFAPFVISLLGPRFGFTPVFIVGICVALASIPPVVRATRYHETLSHPRSDDSRQPSNDRAEF